MKGSRSSQENKKLFMELAAKHSITLPEGYKFNREEIYDRLGDTLSHLGKRNDKLPKREVKEDVSQAIATVRKNIPR